MIYDRILVLPARRLADDGFAAWDQVRKHRYEALVAKIRPHPTSAGALKWLKV